MGSDAVSVAIDAVANALLQRSPLRFTVATDPEEATPAFRLRAAAVLAAGWRRDDEVSAGLEHDPYDERAVHVIGWDGDVAVTSGRIVLPPGTLPTEEACALTVSPAGKVADVGRMVVARSHQDPRHGVFVLLLARLYLEVRGQGFDVACGMMTPRVRALARHLGIRLELLGDDRAYWGEQRAPVRFELATSAPSLQERWAEPT